MGKERNGKRVTERGAERERKKEGAKYKERWCRLSYIDIGSHDRPDSIINI